MPLFQAKFAANLRNDDDALSCIRLRLATRNWKSKYSFIVVPEAIVVSFCVFFFAVALLNLYNRKAVLKEENNLVHISGGISSLEGPIGSLGISLRLKVCGEMKKKKKKKPTRQCCVQRPKKCLRISKRKGKATVEDLGLAFNK